MVVTPQNMRNKGGRQKLSLKHLVFYILCQKWLFGKMKLLVIRSILEKKVLNLVESWICYALLEVVVELLHD